MSVTCPQQDLEEVAHLHGRNVGIFGHVPAMEFGLFGFHVTDIFRCHVVSVFRHSTDKERGVAGVLREN